MTTTGTNVEERTVEVGPITARMSVAPRSRMAATVASITPAMAPRHPA